MWHACSQAGEEVLVEAQVCNNNAAQWLFIFVSCPTHTDCPVTCAMALAGCEDWGLDCDHQCSAEQREQREAAGTGKAH